MDLELIVEYNDFKIFTCKNKYYVLNHFDGADYEFKEVELVKVVYDIEDPPHDCDFCGEGSYNSNYFYYFNYKK